MEFIIRVLTTFAIGNIGNVKAMLKCFIHTKNGLCRLSYHQSHICQHYLYTSQVSNRQHDSKKAHTGPGAWGNLSFTGLALFILLQDLINLVKWPTQKAPHAQGVKAKQRWLRPDPEMIHNKSQIAEREPRQIRRWLGFCYDHMLSFNGWGFSCRTRSANDWRWVGSRS